MALRRSWMFVPGNRSRMLDKSLGFRADAFIFDLEDAVPAKEKERAREGVKQRLAAGAGGPPQFVRVNGWSTAWGKADIEALAVSGLAGFMIPKAGGREEIEALDRMLSRLETERGLAHGTIGLVPLIETALGLHRAFEIAAAGARVLNLAFGSLDFALDIGARTSVSEMELLYARSQLVVASRAAGIASPVDTVYPNIRDMEGLRRQSGMARELGFQGKLCIHPDQIEIVELAFSPSEGEIQEARDILQAYEQALSEGKGAVEVNGKMVDPPVVERALRTVQFAADRPGR